MRRILFFLIFILIGFSIYEISINIDLPKNKIIEIKAPVMDTKYEKQMAFDYLNTIRQNAGMPYYFSNTLLNTAAQSHANYLILNHSSGHFETKGNAGFTGKTPRDRILHAGYQVGMVKENVTTNLQDYKASVDGLFSAIYHRFGFLDFQSDEIGIGVAQDLNDTDKNAFVYDMGIYELNDLCTQKSYSGRARYMYNVCKDPKHRIKKDLFFKALGFKKTKIKKVVIYPYDGQNDIPPAFYGENPDPLPNLEVSGFPISIQFNDYYLKNTKLISFKLFDTDNQEVKSRLMTKQNDPNFRFKSNQYALFPLKRLSLDSRYKVVVRYRFDGKSGQTIWHFNTRRPENRLFYINGNKGSIVIKPNTTYTVYFEPENPHDTLKTLHFPQGVSAEFIDPNTIKLTMYSKNKGSFEVTSGKKTLHVEVTE